MGASSCILFAVLVSPQVQLFFVLGSSLSLHKAQSCRQERDEGRPGQGQGSKFQFLSFSSESLILSQGEVVWGGISLLAWGRDVGGEGGEGLLERSNLLPACHHFSPGFDHTSFHITVNWMPVLPLPTDCEFLNQELCSSVFDSSRPKDAWYTANNCKIRICELKRIHCFLLTYFFLITLQE